jgi:hypothetical protein
MRLSMRVPRSGMPQLSFAGRRKAYLDIDWQVTYCFAKRLEVSVSKKVQGVSFARIGQDSVNTVGI